MAFLTLSGIWKPDEIREVLGSDKVLTSWNGLMLSAFAEAARVLDRDDYLQVAGRNAEFLLRALRQDSGRLLLSWRARRELVEGKGEVKLNGHLEGYAYLIKGLLELYQTTLPLSSQPLSFISRTGTPPNGPGAGGSAWGSGSKRNSSCASGDMVVGIWAAGVSAVIVSSILYSGQISREGNHTIRRARQRLQICPDLEPCDSIDLRSWGQHRG